MQLNKRGLPPRRIVLFLRNKTPIPSESSEFFQLKAWDRDYAFFAVERLVKEEKRGE